LAAAEELKMAIERVRVFDFDTNRLTTIPAAELAPGMLRARVLGIEGEVWIDGSTEFAEEVRHPEFDEETRAYFRRLQSVFHDVYPQSLERWEYGFRCDMHPEREIALWLHMANCFEHFTAGRDLSPEQRWDIYVMILDTVNNGNDKVHLTTNPATLSRRRVQEIADYVTTHLLKKRFLAGPLAWENQDRKAAVVFLDRKNAEAIMRAAPHLQEGGWWLTPMDEVELLVWLRRQRANGVADLMLDPEITPDDPSTMEGCMINLSELLDSGKTLEVFRGLADMSEAAAGEA
jgi:hypothetical protein